MTKGFAPAKINLTLHVTGQRADGYHLLDSLVVFADVGDRITIQPSDDARLTVTGPMADGVPSDHSNLVLRAAALMDVGGDITLEKHLPAAAGIGGGSSDAAATLRLLSDMTGCPVPAATESLGADLPVCLRARAARMTGIGDQLSDVPNLPEIPAVLVNPRVSVSTPDVFRALTQKQNSAMSEMTDWDSVAHLCDWLSGQRNDLEAPAIERAPVISDVLQTLREQPGVMLSRMSGSGATCFGIFGTRTEAQDAARRLQSRCPEWWSVPTRLS